MRGTWVTHVRNGETENQHFIPFLPFYHQQKAATIAEFRETFIPGDTIEEFDGEG